MLLNALIVLVGVVVAIAVALLADSWKLNREERESLSIDIERESRQVALARNADRVPLTPYRATVGRGEGSARTTSPRLLTEQRWQPRHGEPSSKRAALQESPSPRLSSPPLRLLSGGEGLLVRDTASPKSERRGI